MVTSSMPPPPPPFVARRAFRDLDAPIAGGVAGGLARHLGVPVLWVRLAFVVTALLGGFGIMVYAGLWIFLPAERDLSVQAPGLDSATRSGKRPGRGRRMVDAGPAVALGALAFGVVLGFESMFGQGFLFWPIILAIAGVTLLWRQADESQRERWLDTTGRIDPFRAVVGSGGWASYARIVIGAGLVLTGLGLFAFRNGSLQAAGDIVIAGLLGVLGLVMVGGPWALRLIDDLGAERAERVRTQERADMAAHLHDSVLQTLALIQKNAADPVTVARLARSQERDLRQWLFSVDDLVGDTLAGALREMAAAVEVDHPITVDVVTVGDVALEETLCPVVLATREAVVNAAKHAQTQRVDVYAEVTADSVEVFVRDRGVGFDPDAIAADRHGVRDSIIDRMRRHGGAAQIRSESDGGTEVRLQMPLQPKHQENP